MIRTVRLYVAVAPDIFRADALTAEHDVVEFRGPLPVNGAIACVTDGTQFGFRMSDGSVVWRGSAVTDLVAHAVRAE
jgi:hypothetical protein